MDWYERHGYNSRVTCRLAQLELARVDPRIYSVENDLGLPEVPFDKEFPDRYIQAGIAEADLLGIAAGLSMRGKIPYVNTFATFATMRACEQLRLDIAYPSNNVKVVGYYAGLSGGHAGPTHHCAEDIAVTRGIPNLTVVAPADAYEAYLAILAAAEHVGPVYLRASRADTPAVYEVPPDFKLGKAIRLRDGGDVTIVASGCLVVPHALDAARLLAEQGIDCRVLNMHTLKPLDEEALADAARETRLIATYEDHNVIGGLGSAVASAVLSNAGLSEAPPSVLRFGVPDEFCSRTGEYEEMVAAYGYGPATVAGAIARQLERL